METVNLVPKIVKCAISMMVTHSTVTPVTMGSELTSTLWPVRHVQLTANNAPAKMASAPNAILIICIIRILIDVRNKKEILMVLSSASKVTSMMLASVTDVELSAQNVTITELAQIVLMHTILQPTNPCMSVKYSAKSADSLVRPAHQDLIASKNMILQMIYTKMFLAEENVIQESFRVQKMVLVTLVELTALIVTNMESVWDVMMGIIL